MSILTLSTIVSAHKGQVATIKAKRTVKRKDLSAGNKDREITKISTYNVIWGINRDNKKAVIEARSNGDAPAVNQGLRGFIWIVFNIIKRSIKTGVDYLTVYPAKNKTVSQFIENGVEIGRDGYVAATIPSLHNRNTKKGLETFIICVDGIEWLRVGGQTYFPCEGGFSIVPEAVGAVSAPVQATVETPATVNA